MKLHHCAYMIVHGNSSLMQDFCEFLGATLIWEGVDQGREIAMQFKNGFSIQFSEIHEPISKSSNKKETHFAFSSKNPVEDLKKIRLWFEQQNIIVKTGSWSETELWLDCPEIFINFVIEILQI